MSAQAVNFGWTTTAAQPMIYVTGTTVNGALPVAPPVVKEPAPRPSLRDRMLAKLRREDPDMAARIAALPPMAGAAPEAEVKREDEDLHRKKIILKRTVGVARKGVKNGEPTHTGTVTLVRSLSGDPNSVRNIGVQASGGEGGHVEIPVEDLLKAVEDLRDAVPDKS